MPAGIAEAAAGDAAAAPAPAPAVPVPAADEPPPAAAPAPAPAPAAAAPAPVVSKRRKAAAEVPMDETTTTTDLPPPPQRSLRKKATKGGRFNEVDEDGEAQPSRKKPPRMRRDVQEEEEEDRAAATKSDDSEKTEDAPVEEEKKAEAEPEPEPDSDTDTDTESPASKRRRPKPFAIEIGAALRGFQRHFSYIDDKYNELPNYDLGGAPAIALDVAYYPFKNKAGTLSAGIIGTFDYAVGLGTTYKVPTGEQEGTKSTSAMGYSIGVRGNYAFGSTLSNIVSGGIEFGAQSFNIDHPPPVRGNANIPNVDYKFIRPNILGRFPLMDRLSALVSAGYLMVSSAGEIVSPDYFRGATSSASGLDLGVGAAYEIRMSGKGTLKFLELRPMLTFRRYSFKFNPNEAEDPFVAAGATDDYVGLNLGAATRF